MIDLRTLLGGSLWILGLALILAALSWAYWVAARENVRFRAALSRPGGAWALDGGMMFFCAGLAATARTGWERALWGVLAVVWALLAIGLARR